MTCLNRPGSGLRPPSRPSCTPRGQGRTTLPRQSARSWGVAKVPSPASAGLSVIPGPKPTQRPEPTIAIMSRVVSPPESGASLPSLQAAQRLPLDRRLRSPQEATAPPPRTPRPFLSSTPPYPPRSRSRSRSPKPPPRMVPNG